MVRRLPQPLLIAGPLLAAAALAAITLVGGGGEERERALSPAGERDAAEAGAAVERASLARPAEITGGAPDEIASAEPSLASAVRREATEPSESYEFQLRILDAATSRPVADAHAGVVARRDPRAVAMGGGMGGVFVRVDASGTARIRAGVPTADVLVSSPSYVDAAVPDASCERVTEVRLVASGGLDGRVDGVARAELEGAQVQLFARADARRGSRPDASAELGPDGVFRFDDVAPGLVTLVLSSRAIPLVIEPAVAVAPRERTFVVLRAPSPSTLSGRVVSAGSRLPIAGASIAATPVVDGTSDRLAAATAPQATTGADGTFRLSGVAPGVHRVTAATDYGARASREVTVRKDAATGELELAVEGPAVLRGRVVDRSARGVAGARVAVAEASERRSTDVASLVREHGARGRLASAVAGAGGAFEITVPAEGRYLVAAASGGSFGTCVVERTGSGGAPGELRIVVGEPPFVEGRVVCDEGRGVADASIRSRWSLLQNAHWEARGSSEADGSFRIGAEGAMGEIEVWAEGYVRASVPLPIDAGAPLTVVLHRDAARRAALAGVVVDDAGAAIDGAFVVASRDVVDASGASSVVRSSARADRFGRFELRGLDHATWRLSARASGHRLSAGGGDSILVEVPSAEPVVLTMQREAEPLRAVVTGSIVALGTDDAVLAVRLGGAGDGVALHDDASFRVVGVRPGKLRLVAEAPGFESAAFEEVTLAPGEHVDLGRLEMRPTSRLVVRVEDARGEGVQGARVRLERLPAREAGRRDLPRRIDMPDRGGGRYQRDGVPRAKWRVVASHPTAGTASRTFEVDGARASVTLRLENP